MRDLPLKKVLRFFSFFAFLITVCLCFLAVRCSKIPLQRVYPNVNLAAASWFATESTLFVFYDFSVDQGMNKESLIEYSYQTDEGNSGWIPVLDANTVHHHRNVECNKNSLCGSFSRKVDLPPRKLLLRLRYNKRAETESIFYPELVKIDSNNPHIGKSLLVYGVFNETNEFIQWRSRNNFPNVRNEEATRYGLDRYFKIIDEKHGNLPKEIIQKPEQKENIYAYGYADSCPTEMDALGTTSVESAAERAVFSYSKWIPIGAASRVGCATAITRDSKGEFKTVATAFKNPEVAPAFGALNTPIKETKRIKMVLAPCNKTISKNHFRMQVQRLLVDEKIDLCIDDDAIADLPQNLDSFFQSKLSSERTSDSDMVFTIVLHRETSSPEVIEILQNSLEKNLVPEQSKSSPRAVGAFLFDSEGQVKLRDSLTSIVLWCPAKEIGSKEIPNTSQNACAVITQNPTLTLGSLSLGNLDILPGRGSYDKYLKKYGEKNAGSMKTLSILAPQNTAQTKVSSLKVMSEGLAGVSSFFDGEVITVQADQYFSYCSSNQSENMLLYKTVESTTPFPLGLLSAQHLEKPQSAYELGIYWEYPFLVKISFSSPLAIDVAGSSAIVPFGIPNDSQKSYGRDWLKSSYDVGKSLKLCSRFCDHPIFDSAGIYNARSQWLSSYASSCYAPKFPNGGSGEKSNPNDP